jgi:hypothetical protein
MKLNSGKYILKTKEESISNDKHFLDEYDTAVEWARENVNDLPERFYDPNYTTFRSSFSDMESHQEEMKRYDLEAIFSKISEYQQKYYEEKSNNNVIVYRAICVDSVDDINFKNIGMWWSFEEGGVGCYGSGSSREMEKSKNMIVLKGIVDSENIDWEYGFISFLYYGDSQWECALIEGKPIEIIEIDREPLTKTIKGII